MNTIAGKSVCGGIAFGRIQLYRRNTQRVKRQHIEDTFAETERYAKAKNKAVQDLELLYYKAVKEIGEAEAQIFQIHQMMLEDVDYNESVINIITNQKLNAETAVLMTADSFSKMFSEMEDSYMQARAVDVRDVSDRVISILGGRGGQALKAGEQTIIFADDLAPSETLQMDKEKITAFVTEKGSATSHTAILARSLNIPAIIGAANVQRVEMDGKMAAVDGYTGMVYIEPNEEILSRLNEKKHQKEQQLELLKNLKGKPTQTADGKRIKLYANIGTPEELGGVMAGDAEGIGLFRSEFLYLGRDELPDEDTQFDAYKKVAEGMAGKPVIIRTLDIGADKQLEHLGLEKEENPAIGMRAIRLCLTHTDIFRTQLRAILRASAFGNIMIMLPMIVSADEIRAAKEILAEAKRELLEEGIPFSENIPVGIMIETPAAAVMSDLFAEEADFFSIGTNDLIQYTLAMDRQNEKVAGMINTRHEAIMRLIKYTADSAHHAGIWAGICGELGSDTELIPRFLEMGIDEFSVNPPMVLEIRKLIRENYADTNKK